MLLISQISYSSLAAGSIGLPGGRLNQLAAILADYVPIKTQNN